MKEADAAVDQATKATRAKEHAQRECNARVQDLIGDLNRLRQSQRELQFSPACPEIAARLFAVLLPSLCTN